MDKIDIFHYVLAEQRWSVPCLEVQLEQMLCELEAAAETNFELKPSSLSLNEESAQTKNLKKKKNNTSPYLILFFYYFFSFHKVQDFTVSKGDALMQLEKRQHGFIRKPGELKNAEEKLEQRREGYCSAFY